MTYAADPDVPDETSSLGVFIKLVLKQQSSNSSEYDYSQLGKPSDPRIFRIPNTGAVIKYIRWYLCCGNGWRIWNSIWRCWFKLNINKFEDSSNLKLYKRIQIEDTEASDIVNSVPSSVVLVTPDTSVGLNYSGG